MGKRKIVKPALQRRLFKRLIAVLAEKDGGKKKKKKTSSQPFAKFVLLNP